MQRRPSRQKNFNTADVFELVSSADLASRAADYGPTGVLLTSPPELDNDTTLAAQMMTAATVHGLVEPTDLADFAIDIFDCDTLLERVPRPMSRGERQLCGLLIAFARPFDALFAADPTAGLDARRRRAVLELFRDLAEDRLIVSTTPI